VNKKDNISNLIKNYANLSSPKDNFLPIISKIPVTGKVLDQDDIHNAIEACLDAWLTSGEYQDKFEKAISNYLNIRHTLMVNSGSSANLLALTGLKILNNLQDGDEVITCSVGFPTTINPIIQNGLTPVLIDVDLNTLNILPELVENSVTNKTKGIVIAHTLGNPFHLDDIKKICEKHNLFLMEDNCDAFSSKYNGDFTGTFGDVSTLSFYPAHHITTGEGGAVCTNNTKLKKILESLRDWGRDCYCPPGKDNTCKKRYDWQLGGLPHGYDHKYIYSNIGYNLKATDIQAAIGLSQILKLNQFREKRIQNFNYLYENFSDIESFNLVETYDKSSPSWFGFPITLNNKAKYSRLELIKFYDEKNIGTRLLFGGNISLQPAYKGIKFKIPLKLNNSDVVMKNSFWLGVYPGLSTEMLDFVIKSTKEFISQH
jgi:CDP-4-dehydro-6-deoxyglucose reductase, E1|tara:strand:- start:1985 stop:3271 length:1287 start_codon:yes stop_codon:yes gene_type:complete